MSDEPQKNFSYANQRQLTLKAFTLMRQEEEKNKDRSKLLFLDLAEGLTMSFISAAENFERMAVALEAQNELTKRNTLIVEENTAALSLAIQKEMGNG